MGKQYLILGIHNHQPIGNFDFVFWDCYQKAYLPFLEILKEHPRIKISLHYSGVLWDWLFKNCPPAIELINEMVEKGQIELMSGGFYEPILAILPDADKIGQIQKLNSFLFNHFSIKARGMWLAERVWEPHLAKYIHEAGIEYLAVDDLHFIAAGLQKEDLGGYYLTEEQGKMIKIFPGSKYLRYSIPFKEPQDTIDYLLKEKSKGNLTLMADDGEKFGVWPGTYKLTYEQGWLKGFFALVEKNEDIEVVTFSEYIDKFPPLGRVYLPTASYSEMEGWSLPPKAAERYHSLQNLIDSSGEYAENSKPFVKGGFWRNFLRKYPESNNLYQKMLWISNQIQKYYKKEKKETSSQWLEEARDELWKGQCNDSYWHGLFGGLYLPHLRYGIYQHLIQAENIIDNNTHTSKEWIDYFFEDIDSDGEKEIVIKTSYFSCYIDINKGGVIQELDYRPKLINLVNSLTRRQELYHKQLQAKVREENKEVEEKSGQNVYKVKSIHDISVCKEKDLSDLLNYDHYDRNCLIDHFLPLSTTLKEFSHLQHKELGDFIAGSYQEKVRSEKGALHVTLSRDGFLGIGKNHLPVRLEKKVIIPTAKSALQFQYRIVNRGKVPIHCKFGVEFNINLLGGNCQDRYYKINNKKLKNGHLASQGMADKVEKLQLIDEATGFSISFFFQDKLINLWRFPIETASNSESGFEKVYQSSVLFPNWEINLNPSMSWNCDFHLNVEDLL